MGYLKADVRAELLLNAAIKVMESEGYAAVTARKVAQESGAAVGHINRHFTSLSQLKCQAFLAIVHAKSAEHKAASEAVSGIEAVLALLGGCDKSTHETEIWREVSVLAHHDRALHEIFVYALNLWHTMLSAVIERDQLRCHDTAPATAWRLIALVLGQDLLAMHNVIDSDEEMLRHNLLHFIRLELQSDAAAR
ncbi:AcrR family transcriptional regulator [Pantoea alhagi]|uniref:TetR family transcriptional regulator n=1 Tax=Mixta sp. BE291 TaxID=3158787 RepID=UPI002854CBB6|nr:AcrR family transcriptional regulator [Pantoea alhagi]